MSYLKTKPVSRIHILFGALILFASGYRRAYGQAIAVATSSANGGFATASSSSFSAYSNYGYFGQQPNVGGAYYPYIIAQNVPTQQQNYFNVNRPNAYQQVTPPKQQPQRLPQQAINSQQRPNQANSAQIRPAYGQPGHVLPGRPAQQQQVGHRPQQIIKSPLQQHVVQRPPQQQAQVRPVPQQVRPYQGQPPNTYICPLQRQSGQPQQLHPSQQVQTLCRRQTKGQPTAQVRPIQGQQHPQTRPIQGQQLAQKQPQQQVQKQPQQQVRPSQQVQEKQPQTIQQINPNPIPNTNTMNSAVSSTADTNNNLKPVSPHPKPTTMINPKQNDLISSNVVESPLYNPVPTLNPTPTPAPETIEKTTAAYASTTAATTTTSTTLPPSIAPDTIINPDSANDEDQNYESLIDIRILN